MHRSGKVSSRVAGALLAAVLVLVSCGGDDDGGDGSGNGSTSAEDVARLLGPERPAEGAPVKVGLISDGDYATGELSYELDVGQATATYLNEHHAGIAGRPIEMVTCVDEADPAKGTDCANQMVEEGVVAVVVGSSAVVESIWEPLHEAHVPVMFYGASSASVMTDPDSTFVLSSPTAGLIDMPVQVAKDNDESKVTVVVIDIPAAVSVYETAGQALFEEQGIDLDLVTIPPGTADMAPDMQRVAGGDPGVVHVIGNDTFCISAFNGLRAVGFDGPVTTISQCMTDATIEAVPADFFDGMVMNATAPVGSDDESIALYRAVIDTYADEEPRSETGGISMFTTLAALAAGLEGLESAEGEITPATVISTLKAMPEMELPGSGGQRFRCNGNAMAGAPAVCVHSTLLTTLAAGGEPTTYETVGDTPIED
jgi:branched-chain amino acid transport system substrate-binding protein